MLFKLYSKIPFLKPVKHIITVTFCNVYHKYTIFLYYKHFVLYHVHMYTKTVYALW